MHVDSMVCYQLLATAIHRLPVQITTHTDELGQHLVAGSVTVVWTTIEA